MNILASFQYGLYIVYFLDSMVGSAWWVLVLYVAQMVAVFVIRGRPYSADAVAKMAFRGRDCCSRIMAPAVAFLWNVVSDNFGRSSVARWSRPTPL
jgi:solute carrier family 6 (neurotransmitter transporter)